MTDTPNQTGELPEADANGWLPISCAPRNDVLTLADGSQFWQGFWANGYGWVVGYNDFTIHMGIKLNPTHWKPRLMGPAS